MNNKPNVSFSIIKHFGDPGEAVTLDGHKVYRKEKILIPEYGGEVTCAPYDNHFIYEDPTGKRGRWTYMCTCGYGAVITGFEGYKGDASYQGKMLVCLKHASTGKHADGST
jgi:hypothetical protein